MAWASCGVSLLRKSRSGVQSVRAHAVQWPWLMGTPMAPDQPHAAQLQAVLQEAPPPNSHCMAQLVVCGGPRRMRRLLVPRDIFVVQLLVCVLTDYTEESNYVLVYTCTASCRSPLLPTLAPAHISHALLCTVRTLP